jgi:hypothetical protein
MVDKQRKRQTLPRILPARTPEVEAESAPEGAIRAIVGEGEEVRVEENEVSVPLMDFPFAPTHSESVALGAQRRESRETPAASETARRKEDNFTERRAGKTPLKMSVPF